MANGQMDANISLPTVIFVCGGNSARSVAAEHLCNKIWGDKCVWTSAGTEIKRNRPKEGVIRALKEVANIEMEDDILCRNLDDILTQLSNKEDAKLLAIIVLCCNAKICPRVQRLIPVGTSIMREPVIGPMALLANSCALDVCGAPPPDGEEDAEEVYKNFVISMEDFVRQRLPVLLPEVLA